MNNWKKILFFMYDNQQQWSFFTKKIMYVENNKIEKALKLTHYEFQSSFSFLIDLELIRFDKKDKYWKISKDGLSLILSIQKHKDDNNNKNIIIFLTFVLALSAMAQLGYIIIDSNNITNVGFRSIILVLFLGVTGIMGLLLIKKS